MRDRELTEDKVPGTAVPALPATNQAGSQTSPGSPNFRLDGRRAVVTGASKNIGAAIAAAFAGAGADVLLVARSHDELERTADELRAGTGRRILSVQADVGAADATEVIGSAAELLGGPVDVLVNNAFATGSTFGTSVFDVDDAAWSEVLNVNLMGPFRLARAFGKKMLQGGGGSIINVVSGSGFQPTPTLAPYGASKAALWMLTRYLAAEGAPTVRANAICPGLIERAGQEMTGGQRALLSQVPMGRLGQPDEVAGAAVYLASDASSYTTGEVIFVNGGRPW